MTQLRVALWIAVSSEAQAKDEKASMQEQERVGREWCAANQAQVVKVFWWDGHSRSETDVLTAYEEFAAQGRHEYQELRQMWQRHQFDVLWVYVHDRIARSTALYAQVMGNVIKSGARIFSHTDGWIDDTNVDAFMAIGGFSTSNDIRKLRERRHFGMNRRAARGLPTSSNVLRSHRIIRDAFGHALRLEVDPAQARLWQDVYDLIVEQHVAWGQLENELLKRGHTDFDGSPLRPYTIHESISSPTFWGHSSRFHSRKNAHHRRDWAWVYDPTQSPPEGVIMHRDTHEAVYQGEQRQRFIAEIDRRRAASNGRSRPYRTNRYAGLIVCYGCGYYMTYTGSHPFVYLACRTNDSKKKTCPSSVMLKPALVDAYVERFLARIRAGEDLLALLGIDDAPVVAAQRRNELTAELKTLKAQARRLVALQTEADENLEDIYQEQLAHLAEKRRRLTEELDRVDHEAHLDYADQRRAAHEIIDLGERFWALSDTEINVLLARILGKRRMAAHNGKVEFFVDAPRNSRRAVP